jgi:hypothetical protein
MLFRSPKLGFALLALTATTPLMSTAKANTISLGASRDATIYQNTPDNSNGAGFTMFAGDDGMDSPRRSLLDFDVAGNVPAGSTIDSVQLSLVLQGVAGVDDWVASIVSICSSVRQIRARRLSARSRCAVPTTW